MRRLPEVTPEKSGVVGSPEHKNGNRGHHAKHALVTAVFVVGNRTGS